MTKQQDRSDPVSTKNNVPIAERTLPVAGIGASAGGLDAFKSLLDALPDDTGMAFVLIQHLDPKHASLMADLLAVHTTMPVAQAVEGVVISPNRIYLIPPGVSLAIVNGKLHLSDPIERHGARKAFDFFLRSLAEAQGSRSACVVLSGSGADGSEGLKAVKEAGGFVVVQEPSEAAFDGMPQSAIQTGKGRSRPACRCDPGSPHPPF
jgi:two-component system CheB/CheR fusion protein